MGAGLQRRRRSHAPAGVRYYNGFSFGALRAQVSQLRGTVTDLLIGDLFTSRVDKVWEPMESLYGPEHRDIPSWQQGQTPEAAPQGQLVLPDGRRP